MRWITKASLEYWHTWFAWYPITIEWGLSKGRQRKAWLEIVMRKGTYFSTCTGGQWVWQYKRIEYERP